MSASQNNKSLVLDGLPQRPNLRPVEIANFLGIGLTKVYEMIGEGELPFLRIQKTLRIPRSEFERWFLANLQGGVNLERRLKGFRVS